VKPLRSTPSRRLFAVDRSSLDRLKSLRIAIGRRRISLGSIDLKPYLFPLIGVGAVVWVFFQFPGSIFYNRYFESYTIFDPGWSLRNNLSGWSDNFHLGYENFQELAYPCLLNALLIPIHALFGTEATSKIYPASIQAGCFLAFYVYTRRSFASLPRIGAAIVALFFATNPIASSPIHEGYSGMLIDYALLPIGLLAIDAAASRRAPHFLIGLPILFLLTGMYKIPEVAIDLGVFAALRWKTLRALFRAAPLAVVGFCSALAINLYWALPMLASVKIHATLPVQSDTAGEIAVTTQYASLTNVLMMKVFGVFGAATQTCSGCGWFNGAAYSIPTLIIVSAALAGLILRRRWSMLAVAAIAMAFSTGYRYQDEILGIPYQLVMQLPTFNIFRSASIGSFALVFAYADGLAAFLSWAEMRRPQLRLRTYAAGLACTILTGWPYLSGGLIEYQKAPDRTTAFFVRLPDQYPEIAKRFRSIPVDGPTLLMPNAPFADYGWGGKVNDFLPAYLARPTIAQFYWRQPSSSVQALLDSATAKFAKPIDRAAAMSVMRVQNVLIHDDVVGSAPVRRTAFGRTSYAHAGFAIVEPYQPPIARAEVSQSPVRLLNSLSEPNLVAFGDVITTTAVANVRQTFPCPLDGVIGRSDFPYDAASTPRQAIRRYEYDREYGCGRRIRFTVFTVGRARGSIELLSARNVPLRTLPSRRTALGATTIFSTSTVVRHGQHFAFVKEGRGDVVGETIGPDDANVTARPVPVSLAAGDLFASIPLALGDRVFAFNESSDPTWVAVDPAKPLTPLPKVVVNGYANGWLVGGRASIMLINGSQLLLDVGFAFATAAAAIALIIFTRLRRSAMGAP